MRSAFDPSTDSLLTSCASSLIEHAPGKHVLVRRTGKSGENVWECQDCHDKGPLRELMSRPCTCTSPRSPEQAVLDAIGDPESERTAALRRLDLLRLDPEETDAMFQKRVLERIEARMLTIGGK